MVSCYESYNEAFDVNKYDWLLCVRVFDINF